MDESDARIVPNTQPLILYDFNFRSVFRRLQYFSTLRAD
jgi:hypothetical protein